MNLLFRLQILLCTLFISSITLSAAPQAFFSYGQFFAPGKGPYIETYISLIGNSLKPVSANGKKFAEAEITLMFRQGEKVSDYSKYKIKSPQVSDTSDVPNFVDQQRFALPPGNYTLELILSDANDPDQQFGYTEEITIVRPSETPSFSSLQQIESYAPTTSSNILSKSGYDLIPYVSDFYPAGINKITFYSELYNAEKKLGKDEKFLVTYYIQDAETKQKVGDFSAFSRKSTSPVVIVFGEFPIESLNSGNYNLVVEARDKNNTLFASNSFFFQRSKPSDLSNIALEQIQVSATFAGQIPQDSLNDFLRSMHPIASSSERTFINNQMKSDDNNLKRQFFLRFWSDRNPTNPAGAWENYRRKVLEADADYGTRYKRGYQTDRGITFLKYGAPNSIDSRPSEPNSYPYEVWHYYKIGNFSNRRFVFYNPTMASADYQLLHSDMFGEANNPRWQYFLQSRVKPNNDIYDDSGREGFGTDSDNPFIRPR